MLRLPRGGRPGANAIAELNGGPLAERRLLNDFPARALAAEHPEFTANLFNLLGANRVDASALDSWLEPWKTTFLAASERANVDVRIHAARLNYYEKAIRALLEGDTPLGGLWPLILTWTLGGQRAGRVLPADLGAMPAISLGLLGPALTEHVSDLDKYLDDIEVRVRRNCSGQRPGDVRNGLALILSDRASGCGMLQPVDKGVQAVDKVPPLWTAYSKNAENSRISAYSDPPYMGAFARQALHIYCVSLMDSDPLAAADQHRPHFFPQGLAAEKRNLWGGETADRPPVRALAALHTIHRPYYDY